MMFRSISFVILMIGCAAALPPPSATLDEPLVTGPKNLSNTTATASTLALNFGNNIAVDGRGQIHVVWTEGSSTTGSIAYTRSSDNGVTWPTPGLFATSALDSGMRSSLGPRIAAAGDDIYIAWHGTYEGYPRIYLLHSPDAGKSFVGPTVISDPGIGAAFPSLAASPALVAIVWGDNRSKLVGGSADTHSEIYAKVSHDNGKTFGATTPVSVPDHHSSWTPAVAVQGSELHVAWTDERFDLSDCADRMDTVGCYEEEFYRRSLDGGQTWGPEVRLTNDPAGAPKSSWAPSIAVSVNTVHVAYFDFKTGVARVYYQRSLDRGVTWPWPAGEQLISDPSDTQPSARPVLSVLGDNVRMVYWRGPEAGAPADVYIAASPTAGAPGSWIGPFALTSNIGRTTSSALQPQIALSQNGSNHVVWMDNSTGNRQVFYVRVE